MYLESEAGEKAQGEWLFSILPDEEHTVYNRAGNIWLLLPRELLSLVLT